MKKECEHEFKPSAYSGSWKKGTIWEKCSKCGKENNERPMTKKELKKWVKMCKEQDRKCKEWNKLWHTFSNKLSSPFKYKGYDLMERVERFAKKHPTVKIAHVDDSYFSSSYIAFFPHECKDEYWGTTALLIPQCSGEPATAFFLYPGHVDGLIKVLQEIQKNQKAKPRKYNL